MKKQKREIASTEYKQRLLVQLSSHIGQHNAISMPALYQAVYERGWENRVNDTRYIRHLISVMRDEGVPICSVSSQNGGGYYLAAAGSEMADFLRRDKFRALRILRRQSRMLATSLPNYLGQLKIETETKTDDQAF